MSWARIRWDDDQSSTVKGYVFPTRTPQRVSCRGPRAQVPALGAYGSGFASWRDMLRWAIRNWLATKGSSTPMRSAAC